MASGLVESMELAGRNLVSGLCPQKDYAPYWEMNISPDYRAEFRMSWPQHNIGRWWDALTRLCLSTGFKVPGYALDAMERNAHLFFENPDHMCLQPKSFGGPPFPVELHSLREGLLALNALVRYRHSTWAARKGHAMMESVAKLAKEDGSWDLESMHYYREVTQDLSMYNDTSSPTGSSGRMIESLIWFFETTRDPLAFQLARRFSQWHLENSVNEDGTISRRYPVNHTHSWLGTLRGLFLYGLLTRQKKYVLSVERCYATTVRSIVKESGYTSHDLGSESRGETTSPGDAAQLALWLALQGWPEYLDDAERIVRARILPSQIVVTPALTPVKADRDDRHRDLTARAVGAFGGMHKHPHGGKMSTTDITAADIHTLADIHDHILHKDAAATFVLFHFDHVGDGCSVSSRRDERAVVDVTNSTDRPLLIRVPGWTNRETVRVEVNGKGTEPEFEGVFLCVMPAGRRTRVKLEYDLPMRTVDEMAEGARYRLQWKGDDVVGIAPNAPFLPFYPDAR